MQSKIGLGRHKIAAESINSPARGPADTCIVIRDRQANLQSSSSSSQPIVAPFLTPLFCRFKQMHVSCNVLKPVPQPPLEPELDLNKASGNKLFWGRPCHVDAQHGPKQEAGVQGGGTAPLVGSGAKPQKPAMICTYYNQLYNGKCYSCTQLSTLHFVINLLEPACDMLARGWPRAGTRN